MAIENATEDIRDSRKELPRKVTGLQDNRYYHIHKTGQASLTTKEANAYLTSAPS